MKQLLLIVFALCVLNSKGQKVWDKMNMDSVEFMEKLGSTYEFKVQNKIMDNSRNGYKVLFIGAKAGYLNYMILYLNSKHWEFSTTETQKSIKVFAKTYNNALAYDAKLNFQFMLDNNRRITGVTITGTANDVIELFIDYWEDLNINISSLKQKKAVYIMQGTDKVSFSWVNSNPIISITKGITDFEFQKKQNSSE